MCVIAAKPMGVKMPSKSTIENMWFKNPDGAGFMYAKDGKVHIEKGFMKLKDLENALERVSKKVNLDKVSVVLHFRIATHGAVIPANTHPFPVSSSVGLLQKLTCTTTLGVAHNGIISITPRKGISDTMEYIASQLAPLYKGAPQFYKNPFLMEMVDNAINSKLAILNGAGEIYTIGKFETDSGIMYSNTSYKPYSFNGTYYSNNWWYDYNVDDYTDITAGYRLKEERLLRWFDYDEEVTCLDARNRLLDCFESDMAVDSDGHLYEFNYDLNGFIEVEGGRAYDKKGNTLFASTEEDYLITLENIYDYNPLPCVNNKFKLNGKGKKK